MVAPFVFWADHATICKATSYSLFYIVHGMEPILPFNITIATFLVLNLIKPLTTNNLIATCARQLEKHQEDLAAIHNHVLKSLFLQLSSSNNNTCTLYATLISNLVHWSSFTTLMQRWIKPSPSTMAPC